MYSYVFSCKSVYLFWRTIVLTHSTPFADALRADLSLRPPSSCSRPTSYVFLLLYLFIFKISEKFVYLFPSCWFWVCGLDPYFNTLSIKFCELDTLDTNKYHDNNSFCTLKYCVKPQCRYNSVPLTASTYGTSFPPLHELQSLPIHPRKHWKRLIEYHSNYPTNTEEEIINKRQKTNWKRNKKLLDF